MRILFFGDADHVHLHRWVAAMSARGAECHVATRRPGDVPGARSVEVIRPGEGKAGWFLALPQVRAHARRLQPDVVHGHYITSNGLWAAASGRRPVVLTAWGSDILVTPKESDWKRELTGWILRRADLVTADSTDTIAEIRRYGLRASLHEVLWGADTARFTPAARRDPATVEFVSLRSWEPNYNIDTVVDACARLVKWRPHHKWHLHLLGGGSGEAALRAQVQAAGLDDRITFFGRVDEANMVPIMQRCALSISVPTSDATSVSLLESMACGLAAIVSDLPANRQWIDDQGGHVVPVRDAGAIAHAMAQCLDAPERTAARGAHNRQVALARASREAQMDAMYTLYEQLIAGRGSARGG